MRKGVGRSVVAIVLTGTVCYLVVMLGIGFDLNKNLVVLLAAIMTLATAVVVELWRRGRKPFRKRES